MNGPHPPSGLELFVLEGDAGRYYLYAPLVHSAAVVNAAAVNVVNRFLAQGEYGLTADELKVINQLKEGGVIHDRIPSDPVPPPDYLFHPCEVTLFPTTSCNLRCGYCYAEAGGTDRQLQWETARAAVDLVADNAYQAGRDNFVVGFHGGGEPMLNWPLVTKVVDHARGIAERQKQEVHIHAASNGLLKPEQCEFIINHFTGINLSIDGPEDIQNSQRPRRDGGESFQSVMESVGYFEKNGFSYGVRATVTDAHVHRLREIVRFFRKACPSLNQLHIEPVWQCGRCKTSGIKTPDQEIFLRHFLEAWEEGNRLGLNLFYSGARPDTITNKFCAAPGDGFSVTPEGIVTSCFEVMDGNDPRARMFHYGRFDADKNKFIFDFERIKQLRRLTVENIPHCHDCFCKWHCAGDCLAKVMTELDPGRHNGSSRCDLNRAITFAEIKRTLENAAKA